MKRISIGFLALLLGSPLLKAAPTINELKIFNTRQEPQLLSSSKDKLLVVLWATWCPDCKTKLKGDLKAIENDPDVQVLALNTDKNAKRVEEFVKEEGISLPLFYDKEKEFRKSLELFTVPSWAVFQKSKDGSLVLVDKGSPFENSRINTALGKAVFKE